MFEKQETTEIAIVDRKGVVLQHINANQTPEKINELEWEILEIPGKHLMDKIERHFTQVDVRFNNEPLANMRGISERLSSHLMGKGERLNVKQLEAKMRQPLICLLAVAFASRKLTLAESTYSAIKRELFDVVQMTEYFSPYLWGRQFLIKTVKPLVWVGGLKKTSARVACQKKRLAGCSLAHQGTVGILRRAGVDRGIVQRVLDLKDVQDRTKGFGPERLDSVNIRLSGPTRQGWVEEDKEDTKGLGLEGFIHNRFKLAGIKCEHLVERSHPSVTLPEVEALLYEEITRLTRRV
ncbi:hypothetical protein AAG570_008226 [Ranatra chinensis]|uniref:Reverse transcriptase RNase H-like domain-containing protein n=1 Tax=Ranatra chinensis TaxID=642074 RepID=A0ABD0YB67_9HEMI